MQFPGSGRAVGPPATARSAPMPTGGGRGRPGSSSARPAPPAMPPPGVSMRGALASMRGPSGSSPGPTQGRSAPYHGRAAGGGAHTLAAPAKRGPGGSGSGMRPGTTPAPAPAAARASAAAPAPPPAAAADDGDKLNLLEGVALAGDKRPREPRKTFNESDLLSTRGMWSLYHHMQRIAIVGKYDRPHDMLRGWEESERWRDEADPLHEWCDSDATESDIETDYEGADGAAKAAANPTLYKYTTERRARRAAKAAEREALMSAAFSPRDPVVLDTRTIMNHYTIWARQLHPNLHHGDVFAKAAGWSGKAVIKNALRRMRVELEVPRVRGAAITAATYIAATEAAKKTAEAEATRRRTGGKARPGDRTDLGSDGGKSDDERDRNAAGGAGAGASDDEAALGNFIASESDDDDEGAGGGDADGEGGGAASRRGPSKRRRVGDGPASSAAAAAGGSGGAGRPGTSGSAGFGASGGRGGAATMEMLDDDAAVAEMDALLAAHY